MSTSSAGGEGTLQGKPWQYWINRLGMSESSEEDMVSNLLRNLSTSQGQAYNRASDMGANLPMATRLAMDRGVGMQGAQAAQQGMFNISQYADKANRQAWAQILGGDIQADQIEAGEPGAGDYLMSLLGASGQAAGSYYGAQAGAGAGAGAGGG